MKRLELGGKYTLVTGASSGLGLELARLVAREHKGNLVLVARRQDRLEALAEELRREHKVEVQCLPADLTRPEDVTRVYEESTRGRRIHAAILNAGVSYFGPSLGLGFEDFEKLLATNVTSVFYLAQRFAAHLLEPDAGGGGGVMLVSSMAGTMPMTYQAAYGGTKAFLNGYGVALGQELGARGVGVTVFVPGGIATEMGQKSGTARKFKKGDMGMMDADECARVALEGFLARRRFVVPGALNQLSDLLLRFLPRTAAAAMTERIYRGALPPGT
jgi:short-subunit dehydrogenase